ncbi:MAG TPA: hypothetical protein VLL52_10705 [Anaerolineae bacterium]|nr:hypothetical protein [Anaerolineae bacterium]
MENRASQIFIIKKTSLFISLLSDYSPPPPIFANKYTPRYQSYNHIL